MRTLKKRHFERTISYALKCCKMRLFERFSNTVDHEKSFWNWSRKETHIFFDRYLFSCSLYARVMTELMRGEASCPCNHETFSIINKQWWKMTMIHFLFCNPVLHFLQYCMQSIYALQSGRGWSSKFGIPSNKLVIVVLKTKSWTEEWIIGSDNTL